MNEWTKQILVLDRGFVLVGEFRQDPNDFLFLEARNVSTVRRWGTSKGLGELAEKGPRPDTVLDPEECVSINKIKIIRAIRCNPRAWI